MSGLLHILCFSLYILKDEMYSTGMIVFHLDAPQSKCRVLLKSAFEYHYESAMCFSVNCLH